TTFVILLKWEYKQSSTMRSQSGSIPKVCHLSAMCHLITRDFALDYTRIVFMEFANTNKQEIHSCISSPHRFVGNWLCDSILDPVSHTNHRHHHFRIIAHHLYRRDRLLARWSLQKDNLLAFQFGLLSY